MKKPSEANHWIPAPAVNEERRALEPGAFTLPPKDLAAALERYARRRQRTKDGRYRVAMALITFYANRAGKNLSEKDRARLERAKNELRKRFGRT